MKGGGFSHGEGKDGEDICNAAIAERMETG